MMAAKNTASIVSTSPMCTVSTCGRPGEQMCGQMCEPSAAGGAAQPERLSQAAGACVCVGGEAAPCHTKMHTSGHSTPRFPGRAYPPPFPLPRFPGPAYPPLPFPLPSNPPPQHCPALAPIHTCSLDPSFSKSCTKSSEGGGCCREMALSTPPRVAIALSVRSTSAACVRLW
eukprot:163668-Chlamydomonas_euryale.AAC.2